MDNKLSLIKIKNPFIRSDRDIEVIEYQNQSLLDLRNIHFPQDIAVCISVNGKLIPEDKLSSTYPIANDQILFVPEITGGGDDDKGILRVVLMIVVVVVANVAGGSLAGALGIAGKVGTPLVTGVLAMAGGLIVNALLPPPKPKLPSLSDFDASQTYGWSPQTLQQQGIVIPKFYGKNKLCGNIIAAYTESINDKQYLNVLIDLGLGPYQSLSDFKINDQLATNFEGVTIETRLGLLTQDVIPNFNDTKTEYPLSVKIVKDSPYTYTTTGDTFNGIEVDVTFPAGLFHANDSGGLDSYSVGVKVEIKKQGDTDWTTIANETIGGAQTSAIKKTFKADNLPVGIYDIKVSNLTPDQTSSRYGDDMYFTATKEVYYDDFEYPRQVLVGIKALATDQLSGSLRFFCIAECSKVRVYNGTSWGVQFSDNPAWVAWDILTQPVFDNALTVLRYDGIDPSRLDLVKFKEWADFCDGLVSNGKGGQEKRITFNGGLDSESTMWESVLQVCQIGRAILVWNGINLTVAIDKPSTPVQLFSVGNINIDSFKETFLPMEDRAAEIEIDFIDSEKDYERNKFTTINPGIDSKVNKVNLQLFGVTKSSEAWRAGMYRLYNNQYISRTIDFEADIDSIACTVGDVINVQHDIPQWGYGGRVVSATSNSVTIDREITIEAGKSYAIMIRLSTDVVVERNITNVPGTYTILTVSSPFDSIPQQYDVYTFGEITKIAKPFRVVGLRRSQEQKATITAVEYNESIYNVDTGEPVLPTIDYSAIETIKPVTNLKLSEVASVDESGIIKRYIVVTFDKPVNSFYRSANIYYKDTSVGKWYLSGNTDQAIFNIYDISPMSEYEVLVQSVGDSWQKTLFPDSPSELITTGSIADFYNTALQKIVIGLQIYNQGNNTEFEGKDCKLVWNDITAVDLTDSGAGDEPYAGYHIPNTWFKDYEVTIKDTDGTKRRTEYVTEPRYTYTYEKNYEDGDSIPVRSFMIEVRARDRYYRISEMPAKLTVSNPAPPVPGNISVEGFLKSFWVWFDPVKLPDMEGYLIWASQTNNFTPSESNLIYRGKDTRVIKNASGGTWYVKVAAYDSFGEDSLNYSLQYSVYIGDVQILPAELYTSLRTDFIIRDSIFYFSGTTLNWSAGSIARDANTYTLSAGNLANANEKYIIATLSGGTATLSLASMGAIPSLNDNQVIIAFTSSVQTPNGNYICYVRQANSIQLEGANIRDLTVYNGKIVNISADKITFGIMSGERIETKTIKADHFETTLYGDLSQAMDYVKTVLAAGDEYSHDLTQTDANNGTSVDADREGHSDYGVNLRVTTNVKWDDTGAVWDTGTWDIPTKASASWTSASMDLGASKSIQLSLRYTLIEDLATATSQVIKAQYSIDNVNFGTNSPNFDDGLWETLTQKQTIGDTYQDTGNLYTFRYFKIKVELSTTDTSKRIILHTMTYLGNVVNVFGMFVEKVIAAGGTAIPLIGFKSTPAITVTPVGATPLVPLITAQSTTSVTIKLFNLSGTDVGGTANLTLIGA